MPTPDARLLRRLAEFGAAVETALGSRLVCCALAGSGASEDWVAGRSDINTVIVAEPVDAVLIADLAPVVQQFLSDGFAVPLLMDPEFLARAGDVFPIELDDLRRHHRLLAGRDVLARLAVDEHALRRQCEYEGRSRVLRLRALLLVADSADTGLEATLLDTAKSLLVLLRQLVRLRGEVCGPRYAEVLEAAEAWLGPLPVLRRLLDHRNGAAQLARDALVAAVPGCLAEAERIVRAVDRLEG